MAHSACHMALGMAIGTACLLPSVARTWTAREPLHPLLGRLLLWAYGLGLYAIIPGLLGRLGVPDPFCSGWWMNLFLFHPLLDRMKNGGLLVGELSLSVIFVFHYGLLLLAIRRSRRHQQATANRS